MEINFSNIFLSVGKLQCSKLCGEGVQTRGIKCFTKVDKKIEVLDESECTESRPEETKKCILRPCEGVDWITSAWSGVSEAVC